MRENGQPDVISTALSSLSPTRSRPSLARAHASPSPSCTHSMSNTLCHSRHYLNSLCPQPQVPHSHCYSCPLQTPATPPPSPCWHESIRVAKAKDARGSQAGKNKMRNQTRDTPQTHVPITFKPDIFSQNLQGRCFTAG